MQRYLRSKLVAVLAVALMTGLGISSQVVGGVPNGAYTDGNATAPQWLDEDLGDFLVFPYYNIRGVNPDTLAPDSTGGTYQTSFTITNTDPVNSVLVKVRLYDYEDCGDSLDFQLFLSPEDEVVGTVVNDGGRPRVVFPPDETTCRIPWDNGSSSKPRAGVNATPQNQERDTWLEGMIVVAPMGAFPTDGDRNDGLLDGDLARHGANKDCQSLSETLLGGTPPTLQPAGINAGVQRVGNVLRGSYAVLNAAGGYNAGGQAIALANMDDRIERDNPPDGDCTGAGEQCGGPFLLGQNSSTVTNLTNLEGINWVTPGGEQWFAPGMTYMAAAAANIDTILGARSVINNWSTNPANGVGIDWVVTYITDKIHNGPRTGGAGNNAPTCRFTLNTDTLVWDREEHQGATGGGVSPGPSSQEIRMCHCVNLLSFEQSEPRAWVLRPDEPNPSDGVYGTQVIDTSALPQPYGWANVATAATADTFAVSGLSYTVRSLGDPTLSYGVIKPHDLDKR
jgi:hypothetical protein